MDEYTAEQRVRAVQTWMALDLWMSLGGDSLDFESYCDRNGWADTWAGLCHHVRVLRGEVPCGTMTDDAGPCVLLPHTIGPHMGLQDVGYSEPLPLQGGQNGTP